MISNSVGGVKGAGDAALESGGCRLGGGGLSSYIYHHHAESQARRWRGRSRWRRWWRGSLGRCRRRWRRRRRWGWGWLPLDSTANQGKRWMGSSKAWTEPTGEQIHKKSNSLIRMQKLSMVNENASMDISISRQCSYAKENIPGDIMKLL